MSEYAQQTVSSIVRADYRTADVFKGYGINYCCSGNVPLSLACALRQLDPAEVEQALDRATRHVRVSNILPFGEWRTDFLIDYIVNVHHAYLGRVLPALEGDWTAFMDRHGSKYDFLPEADTVFRRLAALLLAHDRHQESTVFPYIKQIDSACRRQEPYGNLFVRTLRKPFDNAETEYAAIDTLFDKLRAVTSDFGFPAGACTNHQVLMHRLRELYDDVLQHRHLERSLLYPKAVQTEQQLLRV